MLIFTTTEYFSWTANSLPTIYINLDGHPKSAPLSNATHTACQQSNSHSGEMQDSHSLRVYIHETSTTQSHSTCRYSPQSASTDTVCAGQKQLCSEWRFVFCSYHKCTMFLWEFTCSRPTDIALSHTCAVIMFCGAVAKANFPVGYTRSLLTTGGISRIHQWSSVIGTPSGIRVRQEESTSCYSHHRHRRHQLAAAVTTSIADQYLLQDGQGLNARGLIG